MGKIIYKNNKFIYTDIHKERVLIDCEDYLSNKSRISMICFSIDQFKTIPLLIEEMIQKELEVGKKPEFICLFDVLVVSQLMRTSSAVRLLEYGSCQGQLSWHLAKMLGSFHEQSNLVCANDRIDNEWLERISSVERLPQLSFMAGDYGQMHLQEKFFDIVVINGTADFAEPAHVISDALRLVASQGILLCCVDEAPLLEDTFKIMFKQVEDYEITPGQKILSAKAGDNVWMQKEEMDLECEVQKDLEKLRLILAERNLQEDMAAGLTEKLKEDIRLAVQAGRADLKIQLINEKEKFIDALIKERRNGT